MGVTGAVLRLGVRWFVPSLLLGAALACALMLLGTTTANADEGVVPGVGGSSSTNGRAATAEPGGLAALETATDARREVPAASKSAASDVRRGLETSASERAREAVTATPVVKPQTQATAESHAMPAPTAPAAEHDGRPTVADSEPAAHDPEPDGAKSSAPAEADHAGAAADVDPAVHEVEEAVVDSGAELPVREPVREAVALVSDVQDEASSAVAEIENKTRSAASDVGELVRQTDTLRSPLPGPDLGDAVHGITGTLEDTLLHSVDATGGGVASPSAILVEILEPPHPSQTVPGPSDHAAPATTDGQPARDQRGARDTTGGPRRPVAATHADVTPEGAAKHLADRSSSITTGSPGPGATRTHAVTTLTPQGQGEPARGLHTLGAIAGVASTSSPSGGDSSTVCLNASCNPLAGHLEEPALAAAWLWPGSRTILPGFAPD